MPGELYLWGSGGGASEIRHLIDDLNRDGEKYLIKGIVGRGTCLERGDLSDLPYIDTAQNGWQAAIARMALAVVTTGDPALREKMWREIRELGLASPILIHPCATVAKTAKLAAGCIVGPHATLSAAVTLAENVYVSFNASIGHDAHLGAHSVISPGARVGGEVTCGSRFFIGLGGIVVPRVRIGERASVSAGALVTRSLPDDARSVALPSRVIGSKMPSSADSA